jgi:hypothetical protein
MGRLKRGWTEQVGMQVKSWESESLPFFLFLLWPILSLQGHQVPFNG